MPRKWAQSLNLTEEPRTTKNKIRETERKEPALVRKPGACNVDFFTKIQCVFGLGNGGK